MMRKRAAVELKTIGIFGGEQASPTWVPPCFEVQPLISKSSIADETEKWGEVVRPAKHQGKSAPSSVTASGQLQTPTRVRGGSSFPRYLTRASNRHRHPIGVWTA